MPARTIFFSYARVDVQIAKVFAEELREAGFDVFLDVEFLRPGERFEKAILDRVLAADAFVYFASSASINSTWMSRELTAFIDRSGRPMVPVLIGGVTFNEIPLPLRKFQGIVIHDRTDYRGIRAAAREVTEALSYVTTREGLPETATQSAVRLADGIAEEIRHPDRLQTAGNVFLVHGHDLEFRDEVESFLEDVGVRSVVLARAEVHSRSLLDRFESLALQASFAVVLLSPDDVGSSRRQYDSPGGGERTLRYRARQNVILELGFFYGRLGWDKVTVIQRAAENPWPEFERPSDLAGAVFSTTSGERDWRYELESSLRNAEMLPPVDADGQP
jgi:predicted nucleotide-binding protein